MSKINLTPREVIGKMEALYERNVQMTQKVTEAIGKLEDTRKELEEARKLYQKSPFYIFKKHSLITVIGIIVIISVILLGAQKIEVQ